MKEELQNIVNHIPPHDDYPDSKLQISLPTTSTVEPGEVLEIVNNDAVTKGWKPNEITIIRKSGYISCAECKKALHIHISSAQNIWCMNCKSENLSRNTAEVNVID